MPAKKFDRKEARRLRRVYKTDTEVAKHLGVSPSTIICAIGTRRAAGLPINSGTGRSRKPPKPASSRPPKKPNVPQWVIDADLASEFRQIRLLNGEPAAVLHCRKLIKEMDRT